MTDTERAMLYGLDQVWRAAADAPTAAPSAGRVVSSTSIPRGCSAEVWGRLSRFQSPE